MKLYTLKLIFSLFVIAGLFFSPSLHAKDTVGKVIEITGKVLVTHEGETKPCDLADQAPIFLKDTIETKKDGVVKFSLNDASNFTLRENTKVVVTEFLLDPKKNQRETVLDVALGKVRAVVTKTFNKAISKTELKTPTAVVGVRGTDFAIEVGKNKTLVYCLQGLVQTFNPLFPAQTINVAAGMFTDVLQGMVPKLPAAIPQELLQEIENQFGFPVTAEGLKEKGKEELQKRLPFPLP